MARDDWGDHNLCVDYHSHQLRASCSCGRWSVQKLLDGPEHAVATFTKIHDEHQAHTLLALSTTPAPPVPAAVG